jgi:hypothetical protein
MTAEIIRNEQNLQLIAALDQEMPDGAGRGNSKNTL